LVAGQIISNVGSKEGHTIEVELFICKNISLRPSLLATLLIDTLVAIRLWKVVFATDRAL
jgi:hypothetical protein